MENKQVTQSYIYKNTDNNLVKRPVEIFGPTSTAVQLGNDGSTTVIKGASVYIDTSNLWIKDKLITLNKAGAAASGYSCGFEINEGTSIVGYLKVNTTRDGWLLKAPNTFEATLSTAALLANRTYTLPDGTGTILIGTGVAKQLALWSSGSDITALGAMINGQIIIGSTGNNPVLATITQGSANQVLVTNAAGSITLSLPQDINTTSSPAFVDVGVTGIASIVNKFSGLDSSISGLDGRLSTAEGTLSGHIASTTAHGINIHMSDLTTHAGLTGSIHGIDASISTHAALTNVHGIDIHMSDLTTHAGLTNVHGIDIHMSDLTTHVNNTTSAHGATTSSSPSTILLRDTDGTIPNGAGIQYTDGTSNWGINAIKTGRIGFGTDSAYIFWGNAYPSGNLYLSCVLFSDYTHWDRISNVTCRIAAWGKWMMFTNVYYYQSYGMISARIDVPTFDGVAIPTDSPFEFVYTYT